MSKIKAKTKTKLATQSKVKSTNTDSFLKSLIKESGNELASLMSEETLSNTTDWIDTGSYALNGLMSADIFKGIPDNKIVGFAGAESTGKTYLVLSVAKMAVEKGYVVAFFDSEHSTEKEMLVNRDMDPSKFMYFPVDTVENFRNQAIKIVNKYNDTNDVNKPKLLFILDSLGNLSTNKEMGDSESGSEKKDMTRPGIIKSVFRVLSLKLAKAKIPMLITNHTYASIGSFIPTQEMAGGSGLKYAASIIIYLTAKKIKDKDGNMTGKALSATSKKNRFCKENSKVTAYLDFRRGLHPFFGLQSFGEPLLKEAKVGWLINDERITEKQLWATTWSDELLKVVNENLQKKFAYGDDAVAELSTDIEEDGSEEEK